MIIKLHESKLFTIDPSERFADAYKVSPEIFNELWRRYRTLDYSIPELCELYYIKVGTPIGKMKMDRWMTREKIYRKAQDIMKEGATTVDSGFFGELEPRVQFELFRNIKSGVTVSVKTLA